MSSSGVMHRDGRRRGVEIVKHEKRKDITAVHVRYCNSWGLDNTDLPPSQRSSPLWCTGLNSLCHGKYSQPFMLPSYRPIMRRRSMGLTTWSHPQTSSRGKKSTKWRRFWANEPTGEGKRSNTSLSGRGTQLLSRFQGTVARSELS